MTETVRGPWEDGRVGVVEAGLIACAEPGNDSDREVGSRYQLSTKSSH